MPRCARSNRSTRVEVARSSAAVASVSMASRTMASTGTERWPRATASASRVAPASTSSRRSRQASLDGGQHLAERRGAVPGRVREVRAGMERSAVRGQEHAHRPAAAAGQGLERVHVQGIDIRSLLTVDLDAHEAVVEHLCGRRVRERLAVHHVAPVAGGIADGQEHGQVAGTRLGERVRSPGMPVHGIVGMLEQVRARLGGQPVAGCRAWDAWLAGHDRRGRGVDRCYRAGS